MCQICMESVEFEGNKYTLKDMDDIARVYEDHGYSQSLRVNKMPTFELISPEIFWKSIIDRLKRS